MKKLLIVLGGVFLVLVVVVGAGIAYLAINGSALDRESKAYADAAIPAIIQTWNVDELEKRESPELQSTTSASDLGKLFQMFRKLGNLKAFNGVKGEANIMLTPQNGARTTANYVGSADFDGGSAQIDLGLIKHGEQWQILRFRVNSRAFLEQH